jgi:two-component system response regulator FlrC
MTLIHVIDDAFTAAQPLVQLLVRRRIAADRGPRPAQGVQVVVASDKAEAAMGGPRALADLTRAAGGRSMIVVTEGAPAFALTAEMGGRLLRVALPAAAAAQPLRDGALMMLADVAGAEVQAMVAADPETGQLIDLAARVARTDVTVFINGPTGSGKEVLARQVHAASRRAKAPFVAINCAAIPENMLEAILFGHEKGAFTGAATANKGIIRAAEGGTLMLDEISEMPMGLQSKLLRVLQERALTPIGAQAEVAVDIRVIATSNRDMPAEVAARRFREDLFYRLNVFPLATRALAERPDDIPVLAAALVRRHAPEDQPLPLLTAEAISALMAHDWPGNVRELENVIQRALVMHEGGTITPADLLINATDRSAALALARAV